MNTLIFLQIVLGVYLLLLSAYTFHTVRSRRWLLFCAAFALLVANLVIKLYREEALSVLSDGVIPIAILVLITAGLMSVTLHPVTNVIGLRIGANGSGIMVLNQSGAIISIDDRACRIFGCTLRDTVDQPLSKFIPASWEVLIDHMQASGQGYGAEVAALRCDDALVNLSLSWLKMETDHGSYLVVTVRRSSRPLKGIPS